jgi:hypothetical protein
MKNAIIAFLMSAVVATGTGWIKDKLAFPFTAVEQVKSMAAEADTSNLAMKVLGADADKMMASGMQLCSLENKGATDPCVTKGVDFLKSMAAKREAIGKAAEATQTAAGNLKSTIEAAPFSDSVKPMLAPLMKRLADAGDAVNASAAETDFSMAQLATRLMNMKAGEGPHKAVSDEIEALKTGGLGKAFEKVQMLADLANPKKK